MGGIVTVKLGNIVYVSQVCTSFRVYHNGVQA